MRSLIFLLVVSLLGTTLFAKESLMNDTTERGEQLLRQGLPKEALALLKPWTLEATDSDPDRFLTAVQTVVQCMQKLNALHETDPYLEALVVKHQTRPLYLNKIAVVYFHHLPHFGVLREDRFFRGGGGGTGDPVRADQRDRVRGLRLMRDALRGIGGVTNQKDRAAFYRDFALMWMNDRNGLSSWQLQLLTDLDDLPEYEERRQRGWGQATGSNAPVDEQDNPVFYHVPKSFEEAANDGERWRWCLAAASEYNPEFLAEELLQRADFNHTQFGVQTLREFHPLLRNLSENIDGRPKDGIWSLHTLGDGETLAKLASGIKRFALPDEFNPIVLYLQCVAKAARPEQKQRAMQALASIHADRRQYPKAAGYYANLLKLFPTEREKSVVWRQQLDQITKNWGRFEPAESAAAGKGTDLQYRFRNGKSVSLSAVEIKIPELIADIKTYIRSKPNDLQWNKIQIEQIGYRLVTKEADCLKYLGRETARWTVPLEPAGEHGDRIVTITVPMTTAGAYLLKAEMEGGNTEYVVVWLNDTAILKKQIEGGSLYYLGDATTGAPVPGATLDLFEYSTRWKNSRLQMQIRESTGRTDADGLFLHRPDPTRDFDNTSLLATVAVPGKTGESARFAYLGFTGHWFGQHTHVSAYDEVKTFFISDRPVYRPGDRVEMKCWVGRARYDLPETCEWAGKTVLLEIRNPKGDSVLRKNLTLDAYGGLNETFPLPDDATLGVWEVELQSEPHQGYGSFRVEEYKKPEYEVVIDAPGEPVSLGEKFSAVIKANYYFGSPVTEATVKYKVLRERYSADWFPSLPWDWLYGNGYGWFGYDYTWYPGWDDWGLSRPRHSWMPPYPWAGPPEVVAEREMPIGGDGTVTVELDTALIKELFPNDDQKYTITAEVVDQSRRTIVGSGDVLVAKQPFAVYVSTGCGYYHPGRQIEASFRTRRLDGKPVAGIGKVKLYKISYNDDEPVETVVYSADVAFDAGGLLTHSLTAAEPGQYRLACEVKAGEAVREGACVFSVFGPDAGKVGSGDFRFNDLEILTDKTEYAPGETLSLRVNTDRTNATVLLFLKPSEGVYARPTLLKLDGKSGLFEIPVELRDMPNFFVEAVTVSGGRAFTEVRQIVVPPQRRILNVEVLPSSETCKPGGKAAATLKVTDLDGRPAVGQLVVSIYDKSVEYISGGTNIADIKEFFWSWLRYHNVNGEDNLEKHSYNLTPPNQSTLQPIGVFGNDVFPGMLAGQGKMFKSGRGMGGGGMGGAMLMEPSSSMAVDAMVPMAAAPMEMNGSSSRGQTEDEEGGGLAEAVVRENFADTALWIGALETDKEGVAAIELSMPESLTTWKIAVWTLAPGTRVGHGSAELITRKDLILRMQTPRFLVEKDKVLLSANVHNYLKTDKQVRLVLEHNDLLRRENTSAREVLVPAGGETRIDWEVTAHRAGDADVTMKALTDEESDAMKRTLPVYVHGMLKQEAWSGCVKPSENSQTIEIHVPAERRAEETALTVRFSPTLAGAMIDALPYLVDYPYGCTEQTLNRFLPTVITQKILREMDVDLTALEKAHANLNAQELGDPKRRAEHWNLQNERRSSKTTNPVYSPREVEKMVREGVERLTQMQCADGGWGWFSGIGERSTAPMTALVVHGLRLARENDAVIEPSVIDRGENWLSTYLKKQVRLLKNGELSEEARKEVDWKPQADEADALVLMVLSESTRLGIPGPEMKEMRDFLWRDRGRLSLYGVALYGMALQRWQVDKAQDESRIADSLKILEQYLKIDEENQTACLDMGRMSNWRWWCWHGSEFETHAYYLKLLTRTDPKSEIAPKLVKYLLNNRKHATYWNSTRDTAVCIEAFADFLRATGEHKPEMTVEVFIDGKLGKTVRITPENLFTIDNTLLLEKEQVTTGRHRIELRKTGSGPLYFNVYLQNFTLEDPIAQSGLEVKIERRYYKLDRDTGSVAQTAGGRGQTVGYRKETYRRTPLDDGAGLKSGDLIEVELIVESKNDYESIVLFDKKAAGFEPVELRSGYTGNALGAYVEFRDERVALFVYRLPRGTHSVTYRLRAEQPGSFSALPAVVEAMYAPELKGNSDEFKIAIE